MKNKPTAYMDVNGSFDEENNPDKYITDEQGNP